MFKAINTYNCRLIFSLYFQDSYTYRYISMRIIRTITSFTIICLLVTITITNAKETLRLGAMISQEGPFGLTGFLPAMELALETIKEDETLPFEFEITLNDSMVSIVNACMCI